MAVMRSVPSPDRWTTLVGAIERLARAQSLDEIVDIVRTSARAISGSDGVTFVLRRNERCNYIAEDAMAPLWTGLDFPLNQCVSGWAMMNRKVAIIPDVYDDPRVPREAYEPTFVRSMVMTPVGEEPCSAAIGAYWKDVGEPDAETLGLLGSLARSTATAIENVRLNESLRDLNATLEDRIDNAIAEREKLEAVLRQTQKMEAVGELTGGIAHDFNNLLTIIAGNMDMLALQLDGKLEPRLARAMANVRHSAERAATLTQRLLAFARRQPLQPKAVNIDRLIGGMTELLARALGERMSVATEAAGGLWRVEVDPNQLEASIINLAVNARDAMDGIGTIRITAENIEVGPADIGNRTGFVPGSYVAIAVADTGIGMSADTVARAFDPFFTTKEVDKGTGLGLSQVYGFVKQSGGFVYIDSEPGQGTTVRLYLPKLDAVAETPEATIPAAPTHGRSGETLLVVEDNDRVRAYATEALRELGYVVLEAPDGPSALAVLGEHAPVDLLFTDVVMPGMTGPELAEAATLYQPGLKTLFCSGYTRNAIMNDGHLVEGVEFLPKPFTFAALSRRVREVIDGV
ncbi:MAG: Signal transduction histidine kinase [Rhizorhabdus sp.]|nr:Signal transduction histidine kinase [Rhizorhabdus sp.]